MTQTPTTGRFTPPSYLRSPLLQTFLGSSRLRCLNRRSMPAPTRQLILDAGDGVRLSGAFTRQNTGLSKGLVILLHGWEGSILSTYMRTTGERLLRSGFDVFRLNFRDHGGSHHLNRGLFYGTLLEEVHAGVMAAARMKVRGPVFLCGFSLGGNFALRIAHRWSLLPKDDIELRHIVAVSPAMDPSRTTDLIDKSVFLRRYFRRKWRRSLKIKQLCFPSQYDFSDIYGMTTLRQMTETLVRRYSPYDSAEEYFGGYTIAPETLRGLKVATTIITSRDDPIIPLEDFMQIAPDPALCVMIESYGGHNGFISNVRGNTWYEECLTTICTDVNARPPKGHEMSGPAANEGKP